MIELTERQQEAVRALTERVNNYKGLPFAADIEELLNIVDRVDANNFLHHEDKNPNWVEYPLMKTESQKRVEALRADTESRYVVAFERDTSNPFVSKGAIVFETYLADAKLSEAIAGIRRVEGGLGCAQIYKLVPIDGEEAYEATGFPKEITMGMGCDE